MVLLRPQNVCTSVGANEKERNGANKNNYAHFEIALYSVLLAEMAARLYVTLRLRSPKVAARHLRLLDIDQV